MVYLRIIFTILSALCVAAIVPLGAALGWAWVGYSFFGALLFFALMIFCKQSQELNALKEEREKLISDGENEEKDENGTLDENGARRENEEKDEKK
jgi:hypothetical protein